jgi:hypothetical protein
VNLYLVQLKLFRIGNSAVAPQLDIVCRPNASQKIVNSAQSPAELEIRSWRLNFWTLIQEEIKLRNPPFRLQKPSGDHWSSITLGRANFHLNMLLTPKNASIGIDLYITVPWKQHAFEVLLLQKGQIESEIGAQLQWLALQEKKTSRILLESKIDPRSQDNEAQVKQWFAQYSFKMYEAFKKRVMMLEEPAAQE